jgi:pimeloyl-ACP methyl ester carboxylesterase
LTAIPKLSHAARTATVSSQSCGIPVTPLLRIRQVFGALSRGCWNTDDNGRSAKLMCRRERLILGPQVEAPTLLIVGGDDTPVIEMNREAMRRMRAPVQLELVPGATHLFEEPGALEQVARLATDFCRRHLK